MFNELPAKTRDALCKLADEAGNVGPVTTECWSISTGDLSPAEKTHAVVDEVNKWERKDRAFLYYFELSTTPEVDCVKVAQVFKEAREVEKNDRAYARFNPQNQESCCLYVGGSQNISQRIKEHLGFGAKRTYAMQLAHWSRDLKLQLKLTCARYPVEVKDDVLQALEDTLWETLKPMLGRQGKR